jgi:hypothetical protein
MSESAETIAPLQQGFEIHGVRIALGAPDPDSLDRLVALLPPGLPRHEPEKADPQFVLLEAGESTWRYLGPSGRSPMYADLTLVVGMLDSEIRRWVADHATNVFVHAGAVAHHGRAIVIPGGSFSGKTSLVVELVRAGAEYYSDEYAIIDDRGLVHPYARPLSIRRPGADEDDRRTVESLGGRAGTEPVPVGVIAATVYRSETSFHPERRSAGQGMLALLAHTSRAGKQPDETLTAVRRAASTALVVEGDRGEAASAARLLMELAAGAAENGAGPDA